MSRLIQLVVVVFSLLFFISAQASVSVSIKNGECAVFSDEATDDAKPEGGDKKDEEGDKKKEAEPDCD